MLFVAVAGGFVVYEANFREKVIFVGLARFGHHFYVAAEFVGDCVDQVDYDKAYFVVVVLEFGFGVIASDIVIVAGCLIVVVYFVD